MSLSPQRHALICWLVSKNKCDLCSGRLQPVVHSETVMAETAATWTCMSCAVWQKRSLIQFFYQLNFEFLVSENIFYHWSQPIWDLEITSRVPWLITMHSTCVSGLRVMPQHWAFTPAPGVTLEVILTQIKSKQSLVMSTACQTGGGAWADVQGEVKSRRRGLGATQLHLGETQEDRRGLARWGIPLTQLLLLFPQILSQCHWFQMSSSWPDSLTTWLSSRTEKSPRPSSPCPFV